MAVDRMIKSYNSIWLVEQFKSDKVRTNGFGSQAQTFLSKTLQKLSNPLYLLLNRVNLFSVNIFFYVM